MRQLVAAHAGGDPVPAPTALLPGLDMDAAYAVQREFVEAVRGDAVDVGWKVGMASALRRRSERRAGPIYGQLLSTMVVPELEAVESAALRAPKAEGEIAFVLGRPLRGPGVTVAQALAATRGVVAAIEIIAGRVVGEATAPEDFVADNAASALAVVGGALVPADELDLRLVGMVATLNGEIVGTGAGAGVLGHPAQSVAWLANALGGHGLGLEPGQIVLTGAVAPPVPVTAGDTFTAEFHRLGTVSATFA